MQHHRCPCKERNTRAHSHGGKREWPSKNQGERSQEKPNLQTPWSWSSVRINPCCLSHPVCGLCYGSPRKHTVFFLSPKFCIYKTVLIALGFRPAFSCQSPLGFKDRQKCLGKKNLRFYWKNKDQPSESDHVEKFYKPECYIFPVFSEKTPFLNHSYNKMGRKRASWGCLVQGSYFLWQPMI